MSSNYEQLKTLKEAFSRYQRANRNEQERKRKAQEKRWSIVLTCVTSIIVFIFIMSLYYEISKTRNFIEICRSGTAEEVKAAIEKDKRWNTNMTVEDNGEKITLYMLAARYNPNLEVLTFLEQAGARVDKNIALEEAARYENDEIVKFLLQKGAKTDNWGKLLRDNSLQLDTKKLIADTRPALTEHEIITAAKKYGFEIVASKNEYKKETQKGRPPFSERIRAREGSSSGCVYFCTDSVCRSEGYFFFSSDTFHHKKYSDWRNDLSLNGDSLRSSIRSWLSPKLSGELLDRAVNVLTEICY